MSLISTIKNVWTAASTFCAKIFNLAPFARYAVLLLIGLMIFGMAKCHAADLAVPGSDVLPGQPWVQVGLGSAVVRGETPALGLDIAYPLPITRFKSYIQFGMVDVGTSTFQGNHTENNLIWSAVFVVNVVGGLDAGIGPSLMDHWLPYNGNQWNAALQLDYRFKQVPITLMYRHWSDAGSVEPNYGRDVVMAAWRF